MSDCATENGIAAAMQCTFPTQDQDELAGEKSHRYCSSPANQRIEGWWSFFRRNRSNWWISLFKDIVHFLSGVAHNLLHMECLWFCFSRFLQKDLNKVKDHWKSHKISKSAYSAMDGVPDTMYFLAEYYAHKECKISVSEEQTKEMEVHCLGEAEDSLYEEHFEYVLETEGRVYPGTVKEAVGEYVL